jgi:hypothetical protein
MFSSAPIGVTKCVSAMALGIVIAACAAGGGATLHSGDHSVAIADAGVDAQADLGSEEVDVQVDSGSVLETNPQVGVPVGACLPRKTGGVPIVKMGPTRVGFPTEILQSFVRKGARAAVDDCVHAARDREPKLEGKVVLNFELPTTGGIKGATVSRGVGDSSLHECIIDAFEQAPMPVLRDGGKTIVDNFDVVICPDGRTEWPHEGGFR